MLAQTAYGSSPNWLFKRQADRKRHETTDGVGQNVRRLAEAVRVAVQATDNCQIKTFIINTASITPPPKSH